MSDAAEELLAASASEVLETMFFTPLGGDPEAGAAAFEWVSAELEFHGQPGGRFRVGASRPTARSLAAAFLGMEENEVTEELVGDVVRELANMICGSVLSRLERASTIELLHPELVEGPPPASARLFPLQDGWLALRLELEPRA